MKIDEVWAMGYIGIEKMLIFLQSRQNAYYQTKSKKLLGISHKVENAQISLGIYKVSDHSVQNWCSSLRIQFGVGWFEMGVLGKKDGDTTTAF